MPGGVLSTYEDLHKGLSNLAALLHWFDYKLTAFWGVPSR